MLWSLILPPTARSLRCLNPIRINADRRRVRKRRCRRPRRSWRTTAAESSRTAAGTGPGAAGQRWLDAQRNCGRTAPCPGTAAGGSRCGGPPDPRQTRRSCCRSDSARVTRDAAARSDRRAGRIAAGSSARAARRSARTSLGSSSGRSWRRLRAPAGVAPSVPNPMALYGGATAAGAVPPGPLGQPYAPGQPNQPTPPSGPAWFQPPSNPPPVPPPSRQQPSRTSPAAAD